jgi:hypothetical protein
MPAAGFVNCLAVHPDDADKVVAVFSNYAVYSIWYTTNGGTTWVKAGGNLEQGSTGAGNGPSIRWVQILPFAGGNDAYLCGTSTGLYATDSLNGTATVWMQLAAGSLGKSVVDMIDYRRSDGMTVIATHGYGIWSSTIVGPPTVGLEGGAGVAAPTVAVFPNPLSAHSRVQVDLPAGEAVRIGLYDASGRLVRTLHSGALAAGPSEFQIGGALGAGSYFVRATGEGWSRVVKCVGM